MAETVTPPTNTTQQPAGRDIISSNQQSPADVETEAQAQSSVLASPTAAIPISTNVITTIISLLLNAIHLLVLSLQARLAGTTTPQDVRLVHSNEQLAHISSQVDDLTINSQRAVQGLCSEVKRNRGDVAEIGGEVHAVKRQAEDTAQLGRYVVVSDSQHNMF